MAVKVKAARKKKAEYCVKEVYMQGRKWVKVRQLSFAARVKRSIIIAIEIAICITAATLAIVNGVKGDPNNRLFSCISTSIFMWVPHILERIAKHRFSTSQHAAYIIMVVGSGIIGSAFNVFNMVSWYDCVMHFLSGYVMMIFIIIPFAKILNKAEGGGKKEKLSALVVVLIIFLCSLGTAAFWEILEFGVDVLFNQESQGHVPPEAAAALEEQGLTGIAASWEGMKYVSVLDTDLDMLCHAGGTLVFCLHFIIHIVSGKNLGIKSLVEDIYGRDMNTAALQSGEEENAEEDAASEEDAKDAVADIE